MATNSAIEKSKEAALAQYGSFDIEDMQKEAAELPSGSNAYFKPAEGKNIVRFIPPPAGKKPWKTYHKHYFQMGQDRKNIVCTKYQYGQPCPLCQRAAKLRSSGSKLDMRKARAFEPQSQVYVNIVDMKNPEKGIQLWTMTPGVFKGIMDAIDTAGVKNVADPVKGFNIAFKRKGSNLDTRYSGYAVSREASELPDWQELLPTQLDLEAVETAPSDDEQEEALDGQFEERGGKSASGKGGRRTEKDVTPREPGSDDDEEDDKEDDDINF